ncbi:hypothetical protein NUBL2888_50470 [Klebsiella pneumoniae]|nr:hypothetical protein NUBL2888_50470 [Klebsiella pneumoniae]
MLGTGGHNNILYAAVNSPVKHDLADGCPQFRITLTQSILKRVFPTVGQDVIHSNL